MTFFDSDSTVSDWLSDVDILLWDLESADKTVLTLVSPESLDLDSSGSSDLGVDLIEPTRGEGLKSPFLLSISSIFNSPLR